MKFTICLHQSWPLVKPRVVVTGLGVVSCLGVGVTHFWQHLVEGETGITKLTQPEFQWLPCRVAGQIPVGEEPGQLKPSTLETSVIRQRSLASVYSLVAADEALVNAGWLPSESDATAYTGVSIGRVSADIEALGLGYNVSVPDQKIKRMNPYTVAKAMCNISAFSIGEKFGFTGPQITPATACTAGSHAIISAYQSILLGDAKVMVAGGTDALVSPFPLACYARSRALSCKYNDTPQLASRPFDRDRDGFVTSNGAAVLILEELNHAQDRGADIYAEMIGYGMCRDTGTVTSPDASGAGVSQCMITAVRNSGLTTTDVTYVNAHATSTPTGDDAEALGILRTFGDQVHVASNKGALGHMQGASGAVEAISTVLSCRDGVIPPTVNLTNPDIAGLNYVMGNSVKWTNDKRIGITNSFGFGSSCASCVFSNYIP